MTLAMAGAGIAAFPEFMIDRQLTAGSLVAVLEGQLDRVGLLNILWPAGRFEAPKTRAFVDFMHGWARRHFEL